MKHNKIVLAHVETLTAEIGAIEPEMLAHQPALPIDGASIARRRRNRRARHRLAA